MLESIICRELLEEPRILVQRGPWCNAWLALLLLLEKDVGVKGKEMRVCLVKRGIAQFISIE